MGILGLHPGSPAGADVKELKILLRMSYNSDVFDGPTGDALEKFQKRLIQYLPDTKGKISFRTVDIETEEALKRSWAYTIYNNVTHLRQNDETCWAYCLAMLIGGTEDTAKTILNKTKNDPRTKPFLNSVDGLVTDPIKCLTFCNVHQEFSFFCLGDLRNNWVNNLIYILGISPIMVGEEDSRQRGHNIVISSVISDGDRSANGTYVKIYNPAFEPVSGQQGIHWINYQNLVSTVMFSRFNDRYVFYKKIKNGPRQPTENDINGHNLLDKLIGEYSFYDPIFQNSQIPFQTDGSAEFKFEDERGVASF